MQLPTKPEPNLRTNVNKKLTTPPSFNPPIANVSRATTQMLYNRWRNAIGRPRTVTGAQQFRTRSIALLDVLGFLQQVIVDSFADDGVFPAREKRKSEAVMRGGGV